MKIRNGFVSNSSSSSFIISHPKGEELTKESLHRTIFGSDEEQGFAPHYRDELGRISSHQVVEYIMNEFNSSGSYKKAGLLKKEDFEEVFGGHEPAGVKVPDTWGNHKYKTPDGKDDWEAIDAIRNKASALEMARIFMLTQTSDLYMVEIGDDTAFGSELEHGDALNSSPNIIRYSNH